VLKTFSVKEIQRKGDSALKRFSVKEIQR